MNVMLLTEHHLEFLSVKGGCTGPYESTLVKMPHCWESHVTAQFLKINIINLCSYLYFKGGLKGGQLNNCPPVDLTCPTLHTDRNGCLLCGSGRYTI